MLQLIQAQMNFTYSLILAPDNAFGGKRPDGTWSGLIGQIMAGGADIRSGSKF